MLCAEDRHEREGILQCALCLEQDPAERLQARFWGRRDLWGWLLGLGALPQAWLTVEAVRDAQGWAWILASAFTTGVSAAYFLGQRWARVALFGTLPAALVVPEGLLRGQVPAEIDLTGVLWATRLTVVVVGAGLLAAMWRDPRNQLFFRIRPSRERLLSASADYVSNRVARWALWLSVAGLLLPGLGPVALPMAVTGLYRVRADPAARLPGRREAALALGLACLGTAWFLLVRQGLNVLTARLFRGEPPF